MTRRRGDRVRAWRAARGTHTFKHALLQEAAYDSLLKRTRELHGRVVDVLVAESPERRGGAGSGGTARGGGRADRRCDRRLPGRLRGDPRVAIAEHYEGKLVSSLAHCEAARALYDPGQHHGLVCMPLDDPGVITVAFAAWNLWPLGSPVRAVARAREATSGTLVQATTRSRQSGSPCSARRT